MRNRTILAVGLLMLACLVIPTTRAAQPADFTVADPVDGQRFRLADHRGKVVALHFLLKTECPICLRHTREYAALARKDATVVHVFLKPDSESEIKAWAEKLGKEGAADRPRIYRDPEARLAGEFGVPHGYQFHGEVVHFPALIVLDGRGTELFRQVGKNNSDRLPVAQFKTRLAEAQAKRPVSTLPAK